MFCPKCKSEYKSGIIKCPECGVDLVQELPQETESKFADIETEEILATFSIADVVLIRSILDAEHIDYYFKGESSLYVVKPRVGQVKLMVKRKDVDIVRELLKDLNVMSSSKKNDKS